MTTYTSANHDALIVALRPFAATLYAERADDMSVGEVDPDVRLSDATDEGAIILHTVRGIIVDSFLRIGNPA